MRRLTQFPDCLPSHGSTPCASTLGFPFPHSPDLSLTSPPSIHFLHDADGLPPTTLELKLGFGDGASLECLRFSGGQVRRSGGFLLHCPSVLSLLRFLPFIVPLSSSSAKIGAFSGLQSGRVEIARVFSRCDGVES